MSRVFPFSYCAICESVDNLTIHHVKSKSRGGTDSPQNQITLCENCRVQFNRSDNRTKREFTRYFREKLRRIYGAIKHE